MSRRVGPPEHEVGDFVWVIYGPKSGRPGRIIRVYKANYSTVGWHWRYVIRYVKRDLSDYAYARSASCYDGRAGSFNVIDPLDALARMGK